LFARLLFIVVMSSIFYGWWEWSYLGLLYFTGVVDFAAALWMESFPKHKKKLLFVSMATNLGLLGFFKYSGFAAENLNLLFEPLGTHIPVAKFVLPVGISFYTFQSMSYTIDVYRGECKATHSLMHFFASLMLFPQLVAGPILRARDILPQLLPEPKTPDEATRFEGLKLIAHGYFKKMVIADNLAPFVTSAFGANLPVVNSTAYWWLAVGMFAMQIYCDFSGYTDIARGLAKWMGYEFQLNFDHPYSATSIRDFWSRWHISLSTWFRDYVYIPMGGNKKGAVRAHVNMWSAMLLSGLWHGADWKFIVWGALHATYLSLERLTEWPAKLIRIPLGRIIVTLLVLMQVCVAWVFFRAESMAQAGQVVSAMFNFSHETHPNCQPYVWFFVVGIAYEVWMCVKPHVALASAPYTGWLEPARMAFLLVACIYFRGPGHVFIYFRF
jgi:alginate O-acetyltransferase complex protein AlgI